MNSIFELLTKLPPIVETAITCYSKNNQLFPIKDSTYCLQLTWYWWKSADTELNEQNKDDIVQQAEQVQELQLKSPTLISSTEQMEYMISQMELLSKGVQEYMATTSLPPSVQYKVERGYDRLMESLFNIQTAKSHHVELNRKR